jgi:hypothetical protein
MRHAIGRGLAFAALSLILNACMAQKFNVLRSGAEATTTNEAAQLRIARNAQEYEALFAEVNAGQLPGPTPPAVDFATDLVLFLSIGQKPSAGYGLQVDCVSCSAETLKVKVATTTPPAGAMTAQMITHPFVLVSTARCPSARTVSVSGPGIELTQPIGQ